MRLDCFGRPIEPRQIDARPIGQPLHGVNKFAALPAHHQIDRVATGVAAGEAVPGASVRPYHKRGRIVAVMQRAPTVPRLARFLQRRTRLLRQFDQIHGFEQRLQIQAIAHTVGTRT